jgi:hypothetical protein
MFNNEYAEKQAPQFEKLFAAQDLLYEVGARNFIFFTCPPFGRCPCCSTCLVLNLIEGRKDLSKFRTRVKEWNTHLSNYTFTFRESYMSANVAIYDAEKLFNGILDDYGSFCFKDDTSACAQGNCMWSDGLHPAWPLHNILAADLAKSLNMAGKFTNVLNSR